MNKHTPGPWKIERDGGNPYILDPSMLVRIADVCQIENTGVDGSTKANARLIAAAPELLSICRRLSGFNINTSLFETGMLDDLHSAIAAAEGRG